MAHIRIRLDVVQLVVIHDAELALAQCLRHGVGHLCLRLDHLGLHLLCVRLHLLLARDCHGTAFLRLRLCDALIRFRLIGLQLRTDVPPDIDVGNINGENLKCRSCVETFAKHGLRYVIRIGKHVIVTLRRADRRHNAFADTGNDRRFSCTADEAVNVRTYRDTRLDLQLDAICRHRGDNRCLDDLRIDTHLHCVEHITPREVNCRCALERERNLRAMRRDQRIHHLVHITACEIVCLELVDAHIQPRLIRLDERQNNAARRNAAQAHPDQRDNADRDICRDRRDPQPERNKMQKDRNCQDNDDNEECSSEQCTHENLLDVCSSTRNIMPHVLPHGCRSQTGRQRASPFQ